MSIDLQELLGVERLRLYFELVPAAGSWEKLSTPSRAEDGTEQLDYRCEHYRCHLLLTRRGPHQVVSFRLERQDGTRFAVRHYGVKGTQELVDTLPYTARLRSMVWDFRETSNASTLSRPFILYGSRSGENRLAIGFADPCLDTEKRILFEVLDAADRTAMLPRTGERAVLTDKEVYSLCRPSDGPFDTEQLHDSLFISQARDSWFDVERAYENWLDARAGGYVPNSFPERLLGPVWCSWCFTTDIDEQVIWHNARVAADLGCRLIIIDAGWYHRSKDTIWPEEPMTKDQIAFGRLIPDQAKFPDFRGLIRRIRDELHLGVMLWVAPRYLFRPVTRGRCRLDGRLLESRVVGHDGKPRRQLCTRNPVARQHAAAVVRDLIEQYDIDGIKIDAWGEAGPDARCRAGHTHDCDHVGGGIARWAESIWRSARAAKSDFVVWLDTPGTKRYGNYGSVHDEIWCNPDAHYVENISTQAQWTGFPRQVCDGGWHPRESEANVAKHLAVYLCGLLPELDMDLTILPESHRLQIRGWFRFFERHKRELLGGEFRPLELARSTGGPHSRSMVPVRIRGGSKLFLWCTPLGPERFVLDGGCHELYLFNLTNGDGIELALEEATRETALVRIRDVRLEELARATVRTGGRSRLHLDVPEGGMAEILL